MTSLSLEDLQTQIEQRLPGVLTRIERTAGPNGPHWLDVTNGRRGASIEWTGTSAFSVSALLSPDEGDPEPYVNAQDVVERVVMLLA